MITQKGCIKCDIAKQRLGDKLSKIQVVDKDEHPEIIKKYNLSKYSTPVFVIDSGGFHDVYDSVLYVEKYIWS